MVSFSFTQLATLCMVVSGLGSALASPVFPHAKLFSQGSFNQTGNFNQTANATRHGIQSRDVPSAPHFVVYTDSTNGFTGPPPASDVQGWNTVALAFVLTSGNFDKAAEWASLSASQRKSVKDEYASAGISLIVSVFGATDAPTTGGADPIATADTMAQFVKDYDLDGIDVDYEDFDAFNSGNGNAENWIIDFTKELRNQLPQGQYILSHAPVAPWFAPNMWGGGGYLKVHKEVGDLIDWFYNQNDYTDCSTLVSQSSSTWPETSILEIAANGVPLDKLVVGKPGGPADADNGYMDPSTLGGCLKDATGKGWNGGAMSWEYPTADSSWIGAVRSAAF